MYKFQLFQVDNMELLYIVPNIVPLPMLMVLFLSSLTVANILAVVIARSTFLFMVFLGISAIYGCELNIGQMAIM